MSDEEKRESVQETADRVKRIVEEVNETGEPQVTATQGEEKEPTGIDEEGNLDVAVGVNQQGEVCVQFGVSLRRLCLGPQEAVQLANAIGINANKAAKYLAALEAKKRGGLVGPDGSPVGGN